MNESIEISELYEYRGVGNWVETGGPGYGTLKHVDGKGKT
jgi:hypothetical protein